MKNIKSLLALVLAMVMLLALTACGSSATTTAPAAAEMPAAEQAAPAAAEEAAEPEAEEKFMPEWGRPGVDYIVVDAPVAANENGVVTAAEWADIYPEIVATYEATSGNSYTVSYIEEDPYLVNIYEGYGFAKDYDSAEGHAYCLEDVSGTIRPHPLANCLTCKTADFTALVNAMGVEAYSMAFDEVAANCYENVGCWNCHENKAGNAGELAITHDYTVAALSDEIEAGKIDIATATCGQCHIEYYFHGDTKQTDVPYDSLENMNPDDMLAYYNEIDFADWTQESTGARLLKAQHPEFETFMGGYHAAFGLTCADCHMATETAADGTSYVSHDLVSPLSNETILGTCTQCHGDTDMAEKVHTIQEAVVARETEIGNALAEFNDTLADAVASGSYTEEELDAIRDVYRSAQWYFDFDYVENAEGAHNSKLANYCLDTAADLIAQGMAMFK